jgi:polyhydroxyalkanoate synthesis regulator phasin
MIQSSVAAADRRAITAQIKSEIRRLTRRLARLERQLADLEAPRRRHCETCWKMGLR